MHTKKSNTWKILGLFIMSVFFFWSASNAQLPPEQGEYDYTDEELEMFVEAAMEIMPLQQEAQIKMIEEVEESGLSLERFNTILEARTMGMEADATEEELEALRNTLESLEDIQVEYQQKIDQQIRDSGISTEKFEEIFARYQQDPDLQMRINQIMQEKG
jgi:hypothetical protein